MLEGALILLAGILVGRFLPSRRRRLKPVKPICGCGHVLGQHDPESSLCHALIPADKYDVGKRIQCTCRRYDGPQVYPEFIAPEISS